MGAGRRTRRLVVYRQGLPPGAAAFMTRPARECRSLGGESLMVNGVVKGVAVRHIAFSTGVAEGT